MSARIGPLGEPPEAVYDSSRKTIPFFSEAWALWDFRHLVAELVSRDIKVRYKRSVLGVAWTMLSPLLNMLALTVVFSVILKQGIKNFPVYYLTGAIFWNFFAQATSHAASLTVECTEITRRVFVPRSVFVISAIGVGTVNFAFSLVPLLLIIAVTGYPIHLSWLFLPVAMLIGASFTTGVGLILFTLASRFVDVRETYMVLLSPWFFITPIVYAPSIVPAHFQFLVRYNPMTYLVEIFRAPLYNGWLPGSKTFAFSLLAAVCSLILGWAFYAAKNDEYGNVS
ncbi:MAG: ABC transporter permease [Thermoanaerobaculia bacterium]